MILDQTQAMSSGGLFSQQFYEIDRKVRSECKNYGKNTVIRQYLALAERFNRDLKGQFPFAKYSSNVSDVRPSILGRFIDDYQTLWAAPKTGQPLKSALASYLKNNPGSGLEGWLVFVNNLERFVSFYEDTNAKDGVLALDIGIGFNARSDSSKGQDQIVEWRLNADVNVASFPNGNTQLNWSTGEELSLSLRWANGSEFLPIRSFDDPQKINKQQGTAIFQSNSQWAVFEWLQRFGNSRRSTRTKNWLEFSVPVGIKEPENSNKRKTKHQETTANPQVPAYTSRVGLTLSAVITQESGREKRIAIPTSLPHFAPGLPGEIDKGGKL